MRTRDLYSWTCKPHAAHLIPIIVLEMASTSMYMALLPQLFLEFFRNDYLHTLGGLALSNVIGAFFGIFLGPFFGALSDARGRKPFVLISVIMVVFPNFILAICQSSGISFWYYLAARNVHSMASSSMVLKNIYCMIY